MGFTLKPPPDTQIPPELRNWFKLFMAWARDVERFQKSITSGANFKSASRRLSLRQGVVVDSSRVASTEPGVATVSLTGDLIPSADNTYNIGSAAFRYKDIRQSGTAYLAGVSASGVITGLSKVALSYGAAISGGVSVSGGASFTGGALVGPTAGGSPNSWTFNDFIFGYSGIQILSDGGIVDFTASAGSMTFGIRGFTSLGPADFVSPTSFAAGISAAGGFTYTGPVATLQNLTVNNGTTTSALTAVGNVRVDGALGVTGQGVFVGGVSVSGGVTFGGTIQLTAGAPAGSGITGNVIPITNLTGNVGTGARRWGNVFGGTLTLTNSATIGGTLTLNQPANTNNVIGGSLTVNGQFTTVAGFGADTFPATDNFAAFGGPNNRWNSVWLSGVASLAMGATISSGTTLSIPGGGNYYHVTGTSTVLGISTADPITAANATYQPGVPIIFHLVNNPIFSHSSRIILNGGTTFTGATNNVISFISEGADNWRETSRST